MGDRDEGGGDIAPLIMGMFFLLFMAGTIWCFVVHLSSVSASTGDNYGRAVLQTVRPDARMESHTLYRFDHTTTFVTWTKGKYVGSYQGPQATAQTDVWVTDTDSMKQFCKDFVRAH